MRLWNRTVLIVGYGAFALAVFATVDHWKPRVGCFLTGHDFDGGVCRFCETPLAD